MNKSLQNKNQEEVYYGLESKMNDSKKNKENKYVNLLETWGMESSYPFVVYILPEKLATFLPKISMLKHQQLLNVSRHALIRAINKVVVDIEKSNDFQQKRIDSLLLSPFEVVIYYSERMQKNVVIIS